MPFKKELASVSLFLGPVAPVAPVAPVPAPARDDESLRREAMSDPSVQALFEIFPVEKSKFEEL